MSQSDIDLIGKIEYSDTSFVKGWALSKSLPDEPVTLAILDSGKKFGELTPSVFRWDLKEKGYGRGYHGFIYRLPPEILDGNPHELSFVFDQTEQELTGSPVHLNHKPEYNFTPVEISDLTGNKVLVVAPHSDDESLGSGGSIALHTQSGDPVKVIFLTDGSMGDYTGRYSKEEYVNMREAEALKACSRLGVEDVVFWREPDRNLSSNQKNINRLSDLLSEYKPGLIYAPSPFEFHPDHRAAAELLWRAIQKSGISCKIAFAEINTAVRINTLVDITPVIKKKKSACNAYKSQIDNTPYTDISLGLNRFRSLPVSEESQYAEGFFIIDSSDIMRSPIESFSRKQFFSSAGAIPINNPPLVSVIVRTKNRDALLEEALSSIVMQSYPNIEVVLVNDGDSDLSKLVSEFGKYIEVRYINSKTPLGMAKAANLGLKSAKGKYVNFLDDDDLFYTDHVSKLAHYLITTGQKAAYSDCEIAHYDWTDNGFVLKSEKELFWGVEHDLDRLMVLNYIPNMVVMFEKSLLQEIGYMNEELEILEDWDLWIRLSSHASPERIPGISAEYRVFSDHNYDYSKWRMKILEKYNDYSKGDELDTSLLSRIDELAEENRYLRKRLAGSDGDSGYEGGHRGSRNNRLWKILYTIKRNLPKRFVDYIKSKQLKL